MLTSRSAATAVLAAVLVGGSLSGCGNNSKADHPGGPSSPANTSGSHAPREGQTKRVAWRFAAAYARYLNGQLPAAALPDATPAARAQAGAPLPAAARTGELTVGSVQQRPGTREFLVGLSDGAHRFSAQLTVAPVQERRRVTQILAPDVDSVLSRSSPISLPRESRPASAAAREFLSGFLPWFFGHAPASAIHDATSQLVAKLRAHPPRVPPTLRHRDLRLVAIGMQPAGRDWTGLANVTDGQQTYELTLTVAYARGHWLVRSVHTTA